jgi:hypothetical protein
MPARGRGFAARGRMRLAVLPLLLLCAPSIAAPARPSPAEACDRGDGAACLALARAAEPHGAFRAKLPPAEADARVADTVRFGGRACDFGMGEGCLLAGRFDRSNRQHDLLVRGCDLGQAAACGLLGGVERLEKACVADVTVENHAVYGERGGFCAELATLLERDKPRAARFLTLACAQGHKQDCPCKADADCGDEEFFCHEGRCDQMSPD